MVLITRWRKRIQAVRIVIHTFVPLWKSAQMFDMLEKMSQRPEKPLQVKMTWNHHICHQGRKAGDSGWIYAYLSICISFFIFLLSYFGLFSERNKYIFNHQILISSWSRPGSFSRVLLMMPYWFPNCSTTQHSIMSAQLIPQEDANRKTCFVCCQSLFDAEHNSGSETDKIKLY